MTSTPLRLLALPAIAFAFSSCSQHWSETQKSQLSTVSLSEPSVKAGAMKEASGIDSPNASTTVPAATGGGIIPALIGTAIDAGVTAHQKSQFEQQYGQQLTRVNANVPKAMEKKLRASAEKMLRSDEFFGPRLKNDSPNRFSGELVTYGLQRFHRTDDETHLGASLTVQVKLTDANGKQLLDQQVIGRSSNSVAVGELAAQPKKVDALFDEAADNFALQLKSALDRKLNR